MLKAESCELVKKNCLSHGFFGSRGGVSTGVYESLNCGLGSGDDPEKVAANREIAAKEIGAGGILTCYQIHSAKAVVVDKPWKSGEQPEADALVTDKKGVALGVLTADCAPVLFVDEKKGVIGAAHAGWRGAKGGVLEECVRAMIGLGASVENISCAVGPCISWDSYEVSYEFMEGFLGDDFYNNKYFRLAVKNGYYLFDLQGYVRDRMLKIGIGQVGSIKEDTLSQPEKFFSYRRNTLQGLDKYGRQISAIVLW